MRLADFKKFRHAVQGFSKRLEAIEKNPEEAYLIHTEVNTRILDVLEKCGALTYEELRMELKPEVTYNRVTALVSEMIRDGVPLLREGKPVRVRLGESVTGSN